MKLPFISIRTVQLDFLPMDALAVVLSSLAEKRPMRITNVIGKS